MVLKGIMFDKNEIAMSKTRQESLYIFYLKLNYTIVFKNLNNVTWFQIM